jgi:hypothetical protein
MKTSSDLVVRLHWKYVGGDDDPRWQYQRALYAYLAPQRGEILYLGKCDGTTVRARWSYSAKLLSDIESLLINRIDVCANIQCRSSRIRRSGLEVRCLGAWPLGTRAFRDS